MFLTPAFTGHARDRSDLPLREIVPSYIDWSPFFHAWEIRGRYPGPAGRPRTRPTLPRTVRTTRPKTAGDRLLDEKKASHGKCRLRFLPRSFAVGDDIELYTDDATTHAGRSPRSTPCASRWTSRRTSSTYALADYIATQVDSGRADHLWRLCSDLRFGRGRKSRVPFEADHDDYNSIMTKALADRLAEASAEWLHLQARIAWGFGAEEKLSNEELIKEKYRGIRPAPGYPACPDHTEKASPLRPAPRGEECQRRADRELRHGPGQFRIWLLLCPSRRQIFRRRHDRPATRSRTTAHARACPSPKWKDGTPPASPTILIRFP